MKKNRVIMVLFIILFLFSCTSKETNNIDKDSLSNDDPKITSVNTYILKTFSSTQVSLPANNDLGEKLIRNDISLVSSEEQLKKIIEEYSAEYVEEINRLAKQLINGQSNYFSEKVLIILPFVHTSTETDIKIKDVKFGSDTNEFEVYFELFSPEYNDMDLLVKFYVAEITKEEIKEVDLELAHGKIVVNNTRNGVKKSVYYGNEEVQNDVNENETNSKAEGGESEIKMVKPNSVLFFNSSVSNDLGEKLIRNDISLVSSEEQLKKIIEEYSAEYVEEINRLAKQLINGQSNYFSEKVLIIVPFVHTSTETDIKIKDVKFVSDTNEFEVYFELFSPKYNDMDLLVKFYVAEITKEEIKEVDLELAHGKIVVNNTRNGVKKSVYYGR